MKRYEVRIFANIQGANVNNRIKHFNSLPDAMIYAMEREIRGESWEVTDRLTDFKMTSE